ncbi:hypothetical protein [Brevibacillus dissolubilis]|uniref:hypothetical protein n=1 Tax=Brevibacillus dissolubilis TaxID=1844116 RepID=UPI0011164E1C|nr:hypothetical protein [Brevibacillus dissolubilis]
MKESRAQRYRSRRRVDGDVSRFWVLGLVFSVLVLAFTFFVDIPIVQAEWLMEMEMALFSASFTLLAFYLLGLTFVFSRQEQAGQVSHQVIIYVWLGAILYHLFLLITNIANQHVYKAGIILFLGPLFLTTYHFITYLGALRAARQEEASATSETYVKSAYQMIYEATQIHSDIQQVKAENPEIEQMLRANGFAVKMERYITEMQQYLQVENFTKKDMELLEGHYFFMENLHLLVKQHPGIVESRPYSYRRGPLKEEQDVLA